MLIIVEGCKMSNSRKNSGVGKLFFKKNLISIKDC